MALEHKRDNLSAKKSRLKGKHPKSPAQKEKIKDLDKKITDLRGKMDVEETKHRKAIQKIVEHCQKSKEVCM